MMRLADSTPFWLDYSNESWNKNEENEEEENWIIYQWNDNIRHLTKSNN